MNETLGEAEAKGIAAFAEVITPILEAANKEGLAVLFSVFRYGRKGIPKNELEKIMIDEQLDPSKITIYENNDSIQRTNGKYALTFRGELAVRFLFGLMDTVSKTETPPSYIPEERFKRDKVLAEYWTSLHEKYLPRKP